VRRVAGTIALASWLLPAVAMACPVCFDATDANRGAYLGTTVFLSLLPLAAIGSVLIFLHLRSKRAAGAILPNQPAGLRPINSGAEMNFDVRPRTGKAMDSKG